MTHQDQTTWHNLSADWINWADRLAPAAGKINRHMIEAVDLPALTHARGGADLAVLDLASGVGEPAFTFARALSGQRDVSANTPGITGHVTATDIVPEMCDGLSARAQEDGIANITVMPANMENLPFDDQSFDVVSCRFGVMFCDDPDLALRENHRVLRAGDGRYLWSGRRWSIIRFLPRWMRCWAISLASGLIRPGLIRLALAMSINR